jgi:hypothetical protein
MGETSAAPHLHPLPPGGRRSKTLGMPLCFPSLGAYAPEGRGEIDWQNVIMIDIKSLIEGLHEESL